MPNREQLSAFVVWYQRCITGDEKGQAQIFLDRLFQGFGLQGSLDTFPWPQFEDVVGTRSTASPISPHDVNAPTGNEGTTDDSRTSTEKKNIRDAVERIPTTMIRKIEAVAAAGREVRRVRAEALTKMKGGLRALYRSLEIPGANPLKDAHASLDAVLTAYGFSAKKDLITQLRSLNSTVAAASKTENPSPPPGVPKDYRPEEIVDGGLCETSHDKLR